MIKRLFDIIFSFFLFVILSPVMLVIVVWIVIDSEGSPFFNQVRVGKGGNEFVLYKFRTMKAVDRGPQITIGKDSRITSVGRTLRKYKLDELPQLLNILKGDMSFIGPRPEVPRYVALYNEEQKKVLSVKPGLSDPASLAYFNEAELLGKAADPEKLYTEEIMPAKLKLNLEYIQYQSFTYDFKIILNTIGKILFTPSTHSQS